jgi:hypothetical protein
VEVDDGRLSVTGVIDAVDRGERLDGVEELVRAGDRT